MTINDRVKAIRNALELTQIDFGGKTGISQGHLTSIENGKRAVTEKTLKVICATFNVNEEWLRDGMGEMFSEDDNVLMSQITRQYNLDTLDRKIIECFLSLSEPQRKVIKDYVRSLVDAVISEDNYEEYREDYIKEKAAPIAARHGDIDGLQEAADLYDKALREKKPE